MQGHRTNAKTPITQNISTSWWFWCCGGKGSPLAPWPFCSCTALWVLTPVDHGSIESCWRLSTTTIKPPCGVNIVANWCVLSASKTVIHKTKSISRNILKCCVELKERLIIISGFVITRDSFHVTVIWSIVNVKMLSSAASKKEDQVTVLRLKQHVFQCMHPCACL